MGEKSFSFYAKILNKKKGIFHAPNYVVPYKRRDALKLLESLALEDRTILNS
jgi:hypothetical protein